MMNTVLLDKDKHDRNRFNCGTEALNNYLKVMASQQAKKTTPEPSFWKMTITVLISSAFTL